MSCVKFACNRSSSVHCRLNSDFFEVSRPRLYAVPHRKNLGTIQHKDTEWGAHAWEDMDDVPSSALKALFPIIFEFIVSIDARVVCLCVCCAPAPHHLLPGGHCVGLVSTRACRPHRRRCGA